MKGDFSRNTFDPTRHFSRVLQQQGRVTLDADGNEQTSILLHYLRALAADLIGPYGGPADRLGFAITPVEKSFTLGAGHYYVDGLLCECEPPGAQPFTYADQPDYTPASPSLPDGTLLVYLDVWERHITPLEEPAIREVALGGPDTATRAKVVWQVKTFSITDKNKHLLELGGSCDAWRNNWRKEVDPVLNPPSGWLRACLESSPVDPNPCLVAPTSAYRGQENRLYRVEIHADSTAQGGPTFKWSRDNGSAAAAWLGNTDDGALQVSQTHGFHARQWVEVVDRDADLQGEAGRFYRIDRIEAGALYLEATARPAWDENRPFIIRGWDQTQTDETKLVNGVVSIPTVKNAGDYLPLEAGLQVQFQPDGNYRTGDYWLIPARTNGTIEWPGDSQDPAPLKPHGIKHHYAPLATRTLTDGTTTWTDLRCTINLVAGCPPKV